MKFDVSKLGPAIGLVLLCGLLSLLTPAFLTVDNLQNVLLQSTITAVLAVGMTFVILTAGIDLGVGSVLALSGVTMGYTLKAGVPLVLALLLGLVIGSACGLINGLLITKGKLPPFIATLGMMSAARGMAYVVSGGRPFSGFGQEHPNFLSLSAPPVMIGLMILIFAVAWFVLNSTTFGRAVYAIGDNEEAAWLSGIPTQTSLTAVYTLCGFLAGLAAILQTARLDSANANAGMMFELNAIAAVVIGGTSLMGGAGSVLGTLGGALIISVLNNGLNLLNVDPNVQPLVLGAVIVFAVWLDQSRAVLGDRIRTLRERQPLLASALSLLLVAGAVGSAWSYRQSQADLASSSNYEVAMVLKTLNNPFWVDMQKAGLEQARSSKVRLLVQAPPQETDVERQRQIMENMIQRKVDAIILAPCGAKELVGVVKEANLAGIPVLVVDSKLDQEVLQSQAADFSTYIGSDNFKGGELAGQFLAEKLQGEGKIALIEGITGQESTDARRDGFLAALSAYPELEVVVSQPGNCDQEKAFSVTQNMFQSQPDIDGIFCCNDVMAMGALRALDGMGNQDVQVVGFDASDDARASIAQGRMLASVAQYPSEMGRLSVLHAVDILSGQSLPEAIGTKVEVISKTSL